MMTMKHTLFTAAALLIATSSSLFAGEGWFTSIPEAQKEAKLQKKALFVEFTGSDWCPPCMMMDKAVFSKKAFVEGAGKDFILVVIDIPNKDKELRAKNQKVLEQYKVNGVPTVVLLNAEGKEITRFVASSFNTVDKMLAELKKQLRMKDMF